MSLSGKSILITGILIISGLVFLIYCFFESRWIKTTDIVISSADVPESFNGSRIVFISDIHLGSYLSSQRLSGIVNLINKIKPEMIILGGDYVHYRSKYIKPVFSELGMLRADYGVYAVLGNHDHYAGEPILQER